MKKLFAVVACLALALASPAFAATTWSSPVGGTRAIAVCTTGTEAAPATWSDGLALWGVAGFAVHVEAALAMTAGTLQAYLYNPESGSWNRAPDLDIAVPAGVTKHASAGFEVTAPTSRIAYLPSGLGVAVTVYIIGAGR